MEKITRVAKAIGDHITNVDGSSGQLWSAGDPRPPVPPKDGPGKHHDQTGGPRMKQTMRDNPPQQNRSEQVARKDTRPPDHGRPIEQPQIQRRRLSLGQSGTATAPLTVVYRSEEAASKTPKRDQSLEDTLLADLSRVNKAYSAQLEQQEKELTVLRKQSKELATLQAEFRELQADRLHPLTTENWTSMETSIIEQRLNALRSSIADFGRANAVDTLAECRIKSAGDSMILKGALAEVVRFDGKDLDIRDELKDTIKAPMLCLTGLLSQTICRRIFEVPFFFMTNDLLASLDGIETPHRGSSPAMNGAALMTLYQTFQKVDMGNAQRWRSDTLRFLNPATGTDEYGERVRHATRQCREAICQKEADDFLNGPAQFMMKFNKPGSESFKQGKELVGIFKQAGSLAVQLWMERTAVRCLDLGGLQNLSTPARNDPLLQAHPLHQYDEPTKINQDPRFVKVVVHPAILGLGTGDGTHYDLSQTWSKAVVWLKSPDVVMPNNDCNGEAGHQNRQDV